MDSGTRKALIKSIGLENILKVMGVVYSEKSDYFSVSSPFRIDKDPSLVVFKDTGHCVDYGGTFSGSILKLFWEITGQSLIDFYEISKDFLYDKQFEVNIKEKSRTSFEEIAYKDIQIEGHLYDVEDSPTAMAYCRKRKISAAFRDHFGIKWSVNAKFNGVPWNDRLVIPLIEGGKIINYEGRRAIESHEKKVLYVKGGSAQSLFNLDELHTDQPLVVVEGIMDLVLIWLYITRNVTTSFGIQMTYKQSELIQNFEDVILFPDGDDGGDRFIGNLDKILKEQEFQVAKHESLDPGDMNLGQIQLCLKNKISATRYFMNDAGIFEKKDLAKFW